LWDPLIAPHDPYGTGRPVTDDADFVRTGPKHDHRIQVSFASFDVKNRGQRGEAAGAIASTRYLQRTMIDIELNNFVPRTWRQSFLVRTYAVCRTKTHEPIVMNARTQFITAMIAAK